MQGQSLGTLLHQVLAYLLPSPLCSPAAGNNYYSQLGTGDSNNALAPVPVAGNHLFSSLSACKGTYTFTWCVG